MKTINVSGKRKTAIARATLKKGTGKIKINKFPLDSYSNEIGRLKIKEPFVLAGDVASKVDIDINVKGGGCSGQIEAIRLVIGKSLAEFDASLKEVFDNYDRHLLVADVRRKEQRKRPDGRKVL